MKRLEIFVFGSNLAGIHGAGAALEAKLHHGAIQHVGYGLTGMSFAIPTKACHINTRYDKCFIGVGRPLLKNSIIPFVDGFLTYASLMQHLLTFKVTRIGCGLAGHKDADIAPLFLNAPSNCSFDSKWREFLGEDKNYWGTF